MSSLTWQIGRKSTEQHGCYESRSIKLNFSDSPAYYTTVLHKYNSPAVFLREDTEEGAKLAIRGVLLCNRIPKGNTKPELNQTQDFYLP